MYRYINKIIILSLFLFCTTTCTWGYEEDIEDTIFSDADWLGVANIESEEPNVLSRVAVIYDRDYKKVLYEKNMCEKVPNASTTKILTAIVAYENSKPEEVVIAGKRAAAIGGSKIGLRSGDKITMNDLMKGLLMSSGNDAAIAIAEHVGGSVENFCEMMNKRAKELGATSTNFTSPHGLDNDNHYTSAQDLLIFTEYLLDIEYLAKIVKMSNASIKMGDRIKNIRTTNEMLSIYSDVTGIKTGFTNKAGRCLITSLKRNERELIIIVLGADTKKQRTSDTIKLINYGMNAFEEIDLYENMKKQFVITVEKAKNRRYEITMSGEFIDIIKSTDKDKITYKYDINKYFVAPVKEGEMLGQISVYLNNELLNIVNLTANYTIERMTISEYMEEIIKNKLKYIEFVQ